MNEGEQVMTVGSQFLSRLTEGRKPKEKVEQSVTAVVVDAATERIKKSLREVGADNLADTIAETLNLLGVPGRFMNNQETKDAITESAQALKTKPARVTALLGLHSAVGKAGVTEKKAEEALEGTVFQKMIEEIITELGFSLGEPLVMKSVKRKAQQLQSNQGVKEAVAAFAKKFQIRVGDGDVGTKKPAMKGLKEAANSAMDPADKGRQSVEEPKVAGIIGPNEQEIQTLLSKFGVNLGVLRPDFRKEVVTKIQAVSKNAGVMGAVRALNRKF